MQIDICKYRTGSVSLWGSPFAVQKFAVFHDSRFQEFLDYLKKSLVSYVM